ncbi:MAG TPA: 16S rRNA (cytosine(1402)-N(4))-methyltransferase RsmH [Patescibacteria group bacterium]|nr:16S rRNA (cytosine(1402)-N(4))-methyltransferase RsmH [Patescibacteria group bacterium]
MTIHKPVFLKETLELLKIKKGYVVVDATLGGGGHGQAILNKIGEHGKYIAFDLDLEAIERFKFKTQSAKFKINENFFLINDNFANIVKNLENLKIEKVDAIVADLGWSSDQLTGKGMSFLTDEELDMRYDNNQELTAKKIINEYPKEELIRILRDYGEEKFAKRIVQEVIGYRERKIIEKTSELAELIKMTVPKRFQGRIHPATRTFQALRIETNKELENLEKFIPQAVESLVSQGRLAIITFHSLEDRIVKNSFRENAGGCVCPKDFPQCVCGKKAKVRIITKKPIAPGGEEVFLNPRSRSAKLRVVEKI